MEFHLSYKRNAFLTENTVVKAGAAEKSLSSKNWNVQTIYGNFNGGSTHAFTE